MNMFKVGATATATMRNKQYVEVVQLYKEDAHDDDAEDIELVSGRPKTTRTNTISSLISSSTTKYFVVMLLLLSIALIGVWGLGCRIGYGRGKIEVKHEDAAAKAKEQNNTKIDDNLTAAASNVKQHQKNVLLPDGRMRVLVAKGCSGSSLTIRAIRKFLQSRGYNVNQGNPEVYKPLHNSMFELAQELSPNESSDIDVIVNATLMLKQEAFQNGQMVVYKWGPKNLKPLLKRTRGDLLFGSMYRKNILDRVVCSIRDCFTFGRNLGYPVFAGNGSKTNLCFDRRKNGEKTKAYIDSTAKMVKRVKELEEKELQEAQLKAFDFPFQVTYEDLTEFEYTDEESVWEASLDAWTRMFSTYVVNNWTSEDAKILNDMMGPMRNTRNISYHEDVIQNYEEVFEALRRAGVGGYIRSRS